MTDVTPPGKPDAPRAGRRRRSARAMALLVPPVLLALALLALRIPAIGTAAANALLAFAKPAPGDALTVRAARGDWVTHLELRGVRLVRGGTALAAADTVRARYRLLALLAGRVEVRSLEVAGLAFSPRLFETPGAPPAGPAPSAGELLRGAFYRGPELRVARALVRGGGRGASGDSGRGLLSPVPDSLPVVRDLHLEVRDLALGEGFAFRLDTLGLRLWPSRSTTPGVAVSVRGSLRDGRLEIPELRLRSPASDVRAGCGLSADPADSSALAWLDLEAAPIRLSEIATLLHGREGEAAALDGDLELRASLRGSSLARATGTLDAHLPEGRLAGLAVGRSRLAVALEAGRAEVTAQLEIEDAPLALRGRVRPFDDTPAYELEATLPRLPARLPGTTWWADFAERAPAAIELRARGRGFAPASIEVAGEALGAAGSLRLRGGLETSEDFAWRLDTLTFRNLDAARLAGDTAASRLEGSLHGGGAITAGGLHRAWARLHLDPSSYGAWRLVSGDASGHVEGERGGGRLAVQLAGGSLSVDSLEWNFDGRGRFRLRDGRLDVGDLSTLSGNKGLPGDLHARLEMEGSGLGEVARGRPPGEAIEARARLRVAPSRVLGRSVEEGEASIALRRGELSLAVDVSTDAGRVALEARGRPFDESPTARLLAARFDHLDLGAWAGASGMPTDLSGTLRASIAWPAPGAAEPGPAWEADLRLAPSRVGTVAVAGGALGAHGSGPRARLRGSIAGPGGDLSVASDLVAAGPDSRVSARLEAPFGLLAALAGRDSLRSDGALTLTAGATGPLDDPLAMTGDGHVRASGSIERARLDSLVLAVRYGSGVVTLDTLTAASNVATATGAGRIVVADAAARARAPAARSDLRAEVVIRDAGPLAPLLNADSVALGSGSVVLSLSGPASAPTLAVESRIRSLAWNDLRAANARAEAHATFDSAWRPLNGRASVSTGPVHVGGFVTHEAHARAELAGNDLRFDGDVRLGERGRLTAAGHAIMDSSGVTIALGRLDLLADTTHWRLARPAGARLAGDRFEVRDFEFASSGGRITAAGALDRRGAQTFVARLDDVGLELLSPWVALGDLRGTADGEVRIEGPAAAPRAGARLAASLTAKDRPAGNLGADLLWNGEGLALSATFASAAGDSLALSGRLPIALSLAAGDSALAPPRRLGAGPSEFRVTGERFPLRALEPLFAPAGVSALDGMLHVDLHVRGSGTGFSGEGPFEVTDGRLALRDLGFRWEDARVRGAWDGDRALLQELSARSRGGEITAHGSVRFASLERVEPDLTVRARRALLVDTHELRVLTTGEVTLRGTLADPVVRGRLELTGSHYQVTAEAIAEAGPRAEVRLTEEDLRELEETFTWVSVEAPDPALAFYDASDLDLTIVLERDNWVRQASSPRLAAEVTGDVRCVKAPRGEPRLFGRLEPVAGRGYVEQLGRSFSLTGGEVLLNGGPESHRFRLNAEYRSRAATMAHPGSDVVVKLDLEGEGDEMRLVLSSAPPMSETDIVSYIATGRTPTTRDAGARGFGSGAAMLGRDIGLSQVTGALEGVAQRSVGLDVLNVRYDGIEGATLVAGRYVSPEVYVGFRQPLQSGDSGRRTDPERFTTQVELEYAAYRWLVLNVQAERSLLRTFLRFTREY